MQCMTRRNLYLPDQLWADLQSHARTLTYERGERVSASSLAREWFEERLYEDAEENTAGRNGNESG